MAAQREVHTTFYMSGARKITPQWEVEAAGKVVIRKVFQESRLMDGRNLDRKKGKGKSRPKQNEGTRMWHR